MNLSKVINFPFNKKTTEETVPVVSSIAVIFNLVNHASTIAAALYVLAMRQLDPKLELYLVDIRDRMPDNVDKYLWMDAGGPEMLRLNCQEKTDNVMDPSALRRWCAEVTNRSVIVSPIHRLPFLSEDTVIGQAFAQLSCAGSVHDLLQETFFRYAVLSEAFNQDQIDVVDYTVYHTALGMAYGLYCGKPSQISDFVSLVSAERRPVVDLKAFEENQRRIAKSILHKSRPVLIENRSLMYVTTLGPDIFGLIRRIGLAKKDFIHVSAGSYSTVVYSNIGFHERTNFERGAFLLTPPFEALKKTM